MKRIAVLFTVFALCSLAQDPPQGERRGRGWPGGGMRMSPAMRILDTDQDGILSAAEIKAAASQLAKLDVNRDRKITEDEVRPQGGGGPEGRRGGPDGGGPQGGSPEDTVNMMMQFDKDHDGKLTRNEVPERMQGVFARYDSNQDGVLTREELMQGASKQAARQQEGPGRREGPPGGFGGGGRGMMRFDPIFAALDADHNGEISESEWKAAAAALAKLDRNGDGQLTADEVRPDFPGGGGPGGRRGGPVRE